MNRFKAVFAAGVLALIFSPAAFHSQNSLPNLKPHQPRDWSDKIVVSNVKGTYSESSLLRETDDLFIGFAVINAGSASVTEIFHVEFFVDGRPIRFRSKRSPIRPLKANHFTWWYDRWIGRLSAGTYTLKIVVDTEDSVSESNERDNEYSRTITVRQGAVSSCFPLTTGVVPQGGGTITASRTSTCSITTRPAQQPHRPRRRPHPPIRWTGNGCQAHSRSSKGADRRRTEGKGPGERPGEGHRRVENR